MKLLRENRKFYLGLLAVCAVLLFYATRLPLLGDLDFSPQADSAWDRLLSILSVQGIITTFFYIVLLDLLVGWRYGGPILWILVMGYQTLRLFMYHKLAISDPGDYIGIFLETNWEEASSYATLQNVLLVLALFVISAVLYGLGRAFVPDGPHRHLLIRIELAVLAVLGGIVTYGDRMLCPPYASFLVTGLKTQSIIRKGDDLSLLKQLPLPSDGPSSREERTDKLHVIFIVGESVRTDHLQLAGYARATTPLLQKRKNRGELSVFPNTLSFATSTSQSVVGMFTNATNENRLPTTGSFVSLFRKHGFQTLFLHNMPEVVPAMKLLTSSCDETRYCDSFLDEAILAYLEALHARDDDRLVVIQTRGSHYHYPNKYPRNQFSIYKPDENYEDLSPGNSDLVNAYDNSILYLDHVLDAVMTLFSDRQAVVVYASDHGESFGEEGRFIHGGPLSAMEQRRVPLLIWASEAFRNKYPGLWGALLKNQSCLTQHGNLFHTLPSLAGIHSALIEPALDLTRSGSDKDCPSAATQAP